MKFSNFTMDAEKTDNFATRMYFGSVDVEIWYWPFTRKVRRQVFRTAGSTWRFMDTGKYTPGDTVEELAMARRAYELFNKGAE